MTYGCADDGEAKAKECTKEVNYNYWGSCIPTTKRGKTSIKCPGAFSLPCVRVFYVCVKPILGILPQLSAILVQFWVNRNYCCRDAE